MKRSAASAELEDRFLRIENAPAFGQKRLTPAQEQTLAILGHVFPIIIYPLKRNESPVVRAHSKEALNFCITLVLALFTLGILGGLLGTAGAIIASLLSTFLTLGAIVLVVIAALQVRDGRILRYPFNLRLIKR